MIVSILNPKGGSGKTTLSINIAACLIEHGYSALLIDADPQGSARDWQAVDPENNPVPVVGMDRPGNFSGLATITQGYDFVLIDGGSKLEQLIAAAIKHADLILIPIQPSALDVWATTELVDLIQTRQTITDGHPPAYFVISRLVKATRLAYELQTLLRDYTFPTFDGVICHRQVYAKATALGCSVLEMPNKAAIHEMLLITDQLIQLSEDIKCR